MAPGTQSPRFRFGDLTLIPDERLLLKNGRPVPLKPKAFDLLVVLADNPGRLLTKEQLMQAVWGDIVVEEANLSYLVFAIRKALGESNNGRYIETVPKSGYRFTAAVERMNGSNAGPLPPAMDINSAGAAEPDAVSSNASAMPRRATLPARPWAVALIVVLGLGSSVALQWWRGSLNAGSPRAIPLTSLAGEVRAPSLSPDGSYVVFSWTGESPGNADLYVQHVSAGDPIRLTTDPGHDYSPSWSPDGRTIAFLRRGTSGNASEVRVIPPLGGSERKLGDIQPWFPTFRPNTISWCPDATCLLVVDSPGAGKPDAVFAMSILTGEKRQLTFPGDRSGPDADPVISPDGRALVFRRDSTPFTGRFYRLPLGAGVTPDGEPVPLTSSPLAAGKPTWLPNGREILFAADGALWRLDALRGGTAARLPFVGEDGSMPVVSRTVDGRQRLVYVRSFADSNIWRIDTSAPGVPAASPAVPVIASTRVDAIPNLSPDGQRLSFLSNRSGESEIWIAGADGTGAVKITSLGRLSSFPRWSPDGKLIAFMANPEHRPDVLVVPSTGGAPRILTSTAPNGGYPSFSRDGQWIYFGVVQEKQRRIWKVPVSGGVPVDVTSNTGIRAVESPDGLDLYYVETVDRPSALWRVALAGGSPVKVLDGVWLGNFDVVSKGIYYITRVSSEAGAVVTDRADGETRLEYFDFSTRAATTVATNLGAVGFGLSASRDGRRVFFSRVDSSVDELMRVEDFR